MKTVFFLACLAIGKATAGACHFPFNTAPSADYFIPPLWAVSLWAPPIPLPFTHTESLKHSSEFLAYLTSFAKPQLQWHPHHLLPPFCWYYSQSTRNLMYKISCMESYCLFASLLAAYDTCLTHCPCSSLLFFKAVMLTEFTFCCSISRTTLVLHLPQWHYLRAGRNGNATVVRAALDACSLEKGNILGINYSYFLSWFILFSFWPF